MKRVGIFILFSFSTFIINANNSTTRFYNDTTLINDSTIEEISEVVVIGKSHKKELQTSGMAVGVAEIQKIANQAIQSTEILNRLSGVKIRQDGGLGSEIKYSINGFSGDAVKIFINGTPAKNYGPSFSLQSIPPSLIERIEVYKGVVPAHLQEDALGGAIDIILKKKKLII
jgi:Outer membrane cobalamin receptor protein